MFCASSVRIGQSKTACIGRSTSSSTRIWPATARTTPRQTLPYSDVLPSMSPEPIPIRPLPCASSSSAPDGTTPFSSSYLATCDSPALQGRVTPPCYASRSSGQFPRSPARSGVSDAHPALQQFVLLLRTVTERLVAAARDVVVTDGTV